MVAGILNRSRDKKMPGRTRHSQKYREASCLGDNETAATYIWEAYKPQPEATWRCFKDIAMQHLYVT
jgi:hypothetical protein